MVGMGNEGHKSNVNLDSFIKIISGRPFLFKLI